MVVDNKNLKEKRKSEITSKKKVKEEKLAAALRKNLKIRKSGKFMP